MGFLHHAVSPRHRRRKCSIRRSDRQDRTYGNASDALLFFNRTDRYRQVLARYGMECTERIRPRAVSERGGPFCARRTETALDQSSALLLRSLGLMKEIRALRKIRISEGTYRIFSGCSFDLFKNQFLKFFHLLTPRLLKFLLLTDSRHYR